MNDNFVFDQIYKGSINGGATERNAHNAAVIGLEEYKKGRYARKVSSLIQDKIKQAIKGSK